ncbi:hypothetical protein SNE26_09245 [Mucilaginibacter sp. cycad4]|uniref:hypothetical protein n=1 Tax=Mucilaginibacter sp. cycad4 TaxID=3342096 RepID=UPI002AAA9198|nr:hypothetical protein [Mucilaginibacter gossypii]WPV01958.1 hypothetical protein SNE26_09245 [Mucilaginibacter gossypii]
MNYWILLRDQGALDYSKGRELLDKAIDLVRSKKCIFIVSEMTYYEIIKQSDAVTRTNTLKIIEQLSEGISLVGMETRIVNELIFWLNNKLNKPTQPIEQSIWAKFQLIIKYNELLTLQFTVNNATHQNAMFDYWSNFSIPDAVNNEFLLQHPFHYKDNIVELNLNKELYKDQNKTPVQMFLSELAGHLDACNPLLEKALLQDFFNKTGRYPAEKERNPELIHEFRAAIFSNFIANQIGAYLPFFNIYSTLFGKFRWNKNRKYKDGNDTLDVMHACGALPYCDYFFTENELGTLINQERFNQLYNCQVASKLADVFNILSTI